MKFTAKLFAVFFLWNIQVLAADFYVAPNGGPTGSGSISSPWDLQTALNKPASVVKPGDTIWLRGGTYKRTPTGGGFTSNLNGTASQPIIVRNYQDGSAFGERATIDGADSQGVSILIPSGSYTWFWGFEIMSSNGKRTTTSTGSWPGGTEIPMGEAIDTMQTSSTGAGLRFINMVLHDTRQGMGWWKESTDSEAYGNLVYYNGWNAPDRGHGHGIYVQNLSGTKKVLDNIVFTNYGGYGIHAYGSSAAFLNNIDAEGNTLFLNYPDILMGGGVAVNNATIKYNNTYSPDSTTLSLGYYYDTSIRNTVGNVQGNYFAGGIVMYYWDQVTFNSNTVANGGIASLYMGAAQSTSNYTWDSNSYFMKSSPYNHFTYAPPGQTGVGHDFSGWKSATQHLDQLTTTAVDGLPTTNAVRVRANNYVVGRGNITIYNWTGGSSATVSLTGTNSIGLATGRAYEVRDSMNFFGPVVTSGTFNGSSITIPLTGLTTAVPIGDVARPAHTCPTFCSFIVLPLGAAPSPTPTPTPSPTPPPPGTIKINFQPASAPTYPGYLVDGGLVYANRGNGYSYGWNVDNTANTRDRNSSSSPDQRYDTLNHMQKTTNVFWEIGLTNGQYDVHLVAGDATAINSVFKINAEGVLTVNGTPTSSTHWIEGTKRVTVSDGRLTITNASGASNNKINYIDITPVSSGPSIVTVEAEQATLVSPMVSVSDSQASGGLCIKSPTTGSGTATFTVNLANTATYIIWGRVLAPNDVTDSFYVSVDGGTEDIYDVAQETWSPYWQWTKVNGRNGTNNPLTLNPRTFSLSAGTHQIRFRGRELNTKLDKIVITDDMSYIPQ